MLLFCFVLVWREREREKENMKLSKYSWGEFGGGQKHHQNILYNFLIKK